MKKIFILAAAGLLSANFASAQAVELIPKVCTTGDASGCRLCELIQVLINASDIIMGLSGTFALLMFIVGGIFMITAYGRTDFIEKGKKTLSAAVVGIGIVFLAWVLVNFTIEALLGGNKGTFTRMTGGREWNQTGACADQIQPGAGEAKNKTQ
ncbi:MAG: pilin [Patescibacteria group bacterium]